MDMKVFEFLPYGKGNAIPSKVLAKVLGFQSVRDLQRQTERDRSAGAVILSTTLGGGGYFLSDDPDELRRFTQTLNARAKNTMKAAESAQRALETKKKKAYTEVRQDE